MEIAMTPNDFLKIIVESNVIDAEKVPDGWYSRKQLEELWGLEKTMTVLRISSGIELGIIESKNFRVPTKNRVVRKIPHYKFHEKENNQKDNKRKIMENKVGPCRKNKRSR
jgi:hypothetical protein